MIPRRSQRLQQQREAASLALAGLQADLQEQDVTEDSVNALENPNGTLRALLRPSRARRLRSPAAQQPPANSRRRRGAITRRISSNQRGSLQQAPRRARRPRGRPSRGRSNTDSVPNAPTGNVAEEGLLGTLARQFNRMVNQMSFVQPPHNPIGSGPSRRGDSPAATGRLNRELSDFMREPPDGCKVEMVDDDIFHWRATILGPPDTPYEGGHFMLDLSFPLDYPFHPPQVYFLTKIYHCNITSSGYICLDILSLQWSPALTVGKVLISLVSLLSDPNPNDPLESTIAHLYKHHRSQHDRNARAWTDRYAKPNQPVEDTNLGRHTVDMTLPPTPPAPQRYT